MGKRKIKAPTASVDIVRDKLNYDPATGQFTWKWSSRKPAVVGKEAGWIDRAGHRVIEIEGNRYKAGRLAWLLVTGTWPELEIDHINRDASDNRIENLRQASRTMNNVNRVRRRKYDLPRGVDHNKNGFLARLRVAGKVYCLGTYPTPEEASAVYLAAARKAYGEFLPKDDHDPMAISR